MNTFDFLDFCLDQSNTIKLKSSLLEKRLSAGILQIFNKAQNILLMFNPIKNIITIKISITCSLYFFLICLGAFPF